MFHAVSTDGSTGTAVGSIVDAGALIAWLMRDQFAERLGTMIDAEAEDELALTNEERAGRLDDLARRTLEAERVEAELLHAAREAGAPVLPRPDHDVRAYLRLSSNLPAPRE